MFKCQASNVYAVATSGFHGGKVAAPFNALNAQTPTGIAHLVYIQTAYLRQPTNLQVKRVNEG